MDLPLELAENLIERGVILRYDSFLCATNIITRSRKELSESIQENRSSLVGHMKQEHLDDVLEMVRNSKLFSNIEKQRFFY